MLPSPHLLVLLLPCFAFAQEQLEFIEPQVTPTVEIFTKADTRYSIHLQPVSWVEANKLCLANKARLLEMTSAAVALYIGEALAESQANTLGLWIGGKAVLKNEPPSNSAPAKSGAGLVDWKWQGSGKLITIPAEAAVYPMNDTPFWGSEPPKAKPEKLDYCLLTARKMHHLPLIAADDCASIKPFICEKSNSGQEQTEAVQVLPPVVVGTKEYFLFHAAFTWAQALAHCRSFGMRLASVVNMEQADALKHRMLRSRPVMENAWISGIFMGGRWVWVTTNEDIHTTEAAETAPTTDKNLTMVSWYRPKQIMKDGCLLADRHVCEHFTYVEANCERKRNFICELEKPPAKGILLKVPDLNDVYVSTGKRAWHNAMAICRYCVEGSLYQPKQETENVLNELYSSMVHVIPEQIRHLWIGGYLHRTADLTEFKWVDKVPDEAALAAGTKVEISSKPGGSNVNGTIALCELDTPHYPFLLNYLCLNLDRENDRDFFMYGLLCENKQYFLCKGAKALEEWCTNPLWDEILVDGKPTQQPQDKSKKPSE